MNGLVRCTVLFVLPATLLGCQAKAPPPPAGPPKADVTLKAGELLNAYNANAVKADKDYKDKMVQLTGKFAKATKAPLLGYSVRIVPEDAPEIDVVGIECFIVEEAKDAAANFKEGEKVTLVGRCDGQVLGQVKLSKCWILKNAPEPAKK